MRSGVPAPDFSSPSDCRIGYLLTLHRDLALPRLAKEDGVSLNQWIAAAVAEKVGVVETAADFFKKRAGKGHPGCHVVPIDRDTGPGFRD